MALLSAFPVHVDVTLAAIAQEHRYIFIMAILTIAFSIFLIRVKLMLAEAVLFFVMLTVKEATAGFLYPLFAVLQIAIMLYVIYRYKRAFDYNYKLILEKTHQAPKHYTNGGNDGTMIPF